MAAACYPNIRLVLFLPKLKIIIAKPNIQELPLFYSLSTHKFHVFKERKKKKKDSQGPRDINQ